MPLSHFVLATAGHVDHGKSALVKALTGTDPDRLPEEKARGITIDLGFARLSLPAPDPGHGPMDVGIVDVPGHEDFVANMVAGVGAIDLALLVVAADDGWMPQTEEHLQVLTYLGVPQAVVALTKIDLGTPSVTSIIDEVRERLQESAFAQAPIIPTSVVSGTGLDALREALSRTLAATTPPRDLGKPRLAIDRAFALRGIGTIVTGTLTGGWLSRGQSVVLQPTGALSRIRSLQTHHQDVESVGPGRRVALGLTDLTLAEPGRGGDCASGVRRGQVVTLSELGSASDTLDVVLERSPRLRKVAASPAHPLRDGARVRVHHGTSNIPARILFLDQRVLEAGGTALAQVRLEAPLFGFVGDRFIVRDWAGRFTLAGGLILEPEAGRRGYRAAAYQGHLARLWAGLGTAEAVVEACLRAKGAANPAALLVRSKFSAAEIAGGLAQLQAAGKVVQAGDLVADAVHWTTLCDQAEALIQAHHRAAPHEPGLPIHELRSALTSEGAPPSLLAPLVSALCQRGFQQAGTALRSARHWPELPSQLQAAGAMVRAGLLAKPFDPPSRKGLAPDSPRQQALRFLLQTGEAVDLGSDVVLLTANYRQAAEMIRAHLLREGPATAGALRQAIGTSRRVIIPLLERMDREGITRREGDLRQLR